MSHDYAKLQFLGPVFHEGLNLTVRLGDKWAHRHGEMVDIVDSDGAVLGTTRIICRLVKWGDIQEQELMMEHAPSCRSLQGLWEDLAAIYGIFDDDALISMVYFVWHVAA